MRIRSLVLAGLATALTASLSPAYAKPSTVTLTLIGTTDIHGHIYPTTYFGKGEEDVGLAKIYTLIKDLRAKNPHTLLVDSGDMLQGSPLTYWHARVDQSGPNPLIDVMNRMGYAAFGVGNHEYNFGLPYLQAAYEQAAFPFVSANTYHHGTDRPVFDPYVIKEVAGVKVGIIGFTPPGVMVWDQGHVEGVYEFRDILASAKQWVPRMKAAGADVILAVPHSGLGAEFTPAYTGYSPSSGLPPENVCAEMARQFPEIDVIFPGHTHVEVPGMKLGQCVIAQAQKWGERLAVADLTLEQVAGKWTIVRSEAKTLTTRQVKPDAEVLAWAKSAHEATLAYVNSPIAETPDVWSTRRAMVEDTPIIDLINTVQLQATGAQLSAAAAFTTDAEVPSGRISIADMASVYPYENTLVAIQITGKQLKDYLEFSARIYAPYAPGKPAFDPEVRGYNYDMVAGVDYQIDPRQPIGSRVIDLRYQGEPVTPAQTFTMALNSYRQRGGGGFEMLTDAPVVWQQEVGIRDLLIDYLKDRQRIAAKDVFVKNWSLAPGVAVAGDHRTYR